MRDCLLSVTVSCIACMQAHYTEVLLWDMAGIIFPADRIHDTA
jgi:hypothetical protein